MNKGFTFLQTIISIALLASISTLVMVSFNALSNKQALEKQIDYIKSTITKVRNDALNSKNGTDQSIRFASTSIVYDGKTIDLENGISLFSYTTGTSTIYFYRLTGFTNATGTLTYRLQKNGKIIATSTITINNLGIVE